MVSGRAGEGKTTFSNFCKELLEKQSFDAYITPFAKAVKETASKGFLWDGEKDPRGRRLLQQIGLAGREYNENIWAEKTLQEIYFINSVREMGKIDQIVFIDDWRFVNEGRIIEDFFPVTKVRVIRPKEFHTLYGSELYNDPSEIGLPEADNAESIHFYDYCAMNLDGLSGLREEADDFIRKYLLPKLQEA
jgi:hypothetical protein